MGEQVADYGSILSKVSDEVTHGVRPFRVPSIAQCLAHN